MKTKLAVISSILPVVLLLDVLTKRWALEALAGGRQLELLGGLVPLTLAFNQGAAFGIQVGSEPRLFFIPVTILAVLLLAVLYFQAHRRDYLRLVSLALILAGALGNLVDRVRWERGVVDFIGPVDLGFMYWPIFNVADMSITCGAILLAISFWREERRVREEEGGEEGEGRGDAAAPELDPAR